MLVKIIHHIFLPCSKASLLMEKKNSGALNLYESFRLNSHFLICKFCRKYQEKIIKIDQGLKNLLNKRKSTKINNIEIQLFKEKIKNKLKN